MPTLKHSDNIAARMGRWSAAGAALAVVVVRPRREAAGQGFEP